MNTASYIVLIIDLEKRSNIIFKINLYVVFPFLNIFYYFNYLYISVYVQMHASALEVRDMRFSWSGSFRQV